MRRHDARTFFTSDCLGDIRIIFRTVDFFSKKKRNAVAGAFEGARALDYWRFQWRGVGVESALRMRMRRCSRIYIVDLLQYKQKIWMRGGMHECVIDITCDSDSLIILSNDWITESDDGLSKQIRWKLSHHQADAFELSQASEQ